MATEELPWYMQMCSLLSNGGDFYHALFIFWYLFGPVNCKFCFRRKFCRDAETCTPTQGQTIRHIYTNGNKYGITYTKLHRSEFDRYLLVPVLSSIAIWSSVDFYNLLPNQLNDEDQPVPTIQRRNWLEWKLPNLLPLWKKSAWQIDGSILCAFLTKSFCIFYHSLMASCHVICKRKSWCVL